MQEFPTGPSASIPAFMLGCALTTVLFLSLIGFTLRRTNVLETSLVFVYVVVSYIFRFMPSGKLRSYSSTLPGFPASRQKWSARNTSFR